MRPSSSSRSAHTSANAAVPPAPPLRGRDRRGPPNAVRAYWPVLARYISLRLGVVRYVRAKVEPLKGKRGRPRWAFRVLVRHHLERVADEDENGGKFAASPKRSKGSSGVSKSAALKPTTTVGRAAPAKPATARAAAAATAAKPLAPKPAALEPAGPRYAAPNRAAAATTGTAKALVSARPAQLSSAAAQLRRQAQPYSPV